MDFNRAFDCVDHGLLIRKLVVFNFPNSVLSWIASYITGRSQSVAGADGVSSSCLPAVRGVPQCSVLGPLLFSLFISDLSDCLEGCNYHLYADDILVYLSFPPNGVEDAVGLMNKNIEAICSWARKNCLTINEQKTKAMIIGSRSFVRRFSGSAPPLELL